MDRSDHVDQLQQRLAELKSATVRATTPPEGRESDVLGAALEQLQRMAGEIRRQNAQLAAARDALEQERTRYRDLFEWAPDAYLITNADGVVSEVNQAAAALLKMDRKFLMGKPLQVFIPADDRATFHARMVELQTTGASMGWRLRMVTREGTPIDVVAAVAPLSDRRDPTGLRWSLRDITSLVRDEARLRDLNLELERRVRERTAALEAANALKDDLLRREREARDAAEEASRSKDEFLATISHELRTPLNVVLGWSYRLRSHTLDEQQTATAIDSIDRNARQQLHLVEELLDSARITVGRFQLAIETIDLGPLTRAAVDALESAASAKGIRLLCEIGEGLMVRADPTRIQQIAWNLVNNAVKFTPEHGTVKVTLTPAARQAVLAVTDSGIGISEAALPHVFEPFYQEEHSTQRASSGLGLGLAIVRRLVELHGGEVDAVSAGPRLGSTFIVRLPLMPTDLPPQRQIAES